MPRAIEQNSRNHEAPLFPSSGSGKQATVEIALSGAGKFVASVEEAAWGGLGAFERALCINRAIQREVEMA